MNCISRGSRAGVSGAVFVLVALAWAAAAHAQSGGGRRVTLVRAGSERGLVRVAQSDAVCTSSRCTLTFPPGTRVTVTAEAFVGGAFSGWVDTPGCSGIGACLVDGTGDATVTALFTGGPNIAFLGAEPVSAALGGLAGADARCQAEAEAAGLPGRYVAYLSTRGVAAPARLAGSRGWVRPDGLAFADRIDDIVQGRVFYPLRIDARGRDLGAQAGAANVLETWTGTTHRGTVASSGTCDDWTTTAADQSTLGGMGTASRRWFAEAFTLRCTQPARLFCFGVGAVGEVTPRIARGRRAFVTARELIPTGGIAQADAACNDEARLAGVRGSFLALLGTPYASAASRFDPGGARWVGVDGLPITARGDSLFAEVPFELPPLLGASGGVLASAVWTGAGSLRDAGAPDETCNDWRGGAGAVGRGGTHTFSTAPYYQQDATDACDGSGRPRGLLCFEQ